MNDLNTVEHTRIVSAESHRATTTSTDTAKQTSQRGKALPVQSTTVEAIPQQAQAVAFEQRSAQVAEAVQQLNGYAQSLQRDLRFSLDEELGRAVVYVIDRTSQEVIRQIPNETALQLARNLKASADIALTQLNNTLNHPSTGGGEFSFGLVNTRI